MMEGEEEKTSAVHVEEQRFSVWTFVGGRWTDGGRSVDGLCLWYHNYPNPNPNTNLKGTNELLYDLLPF